MRIRGLALYAPAGLLLVPFFCVPLAIVAGQSFEGSGGVFGQYVKVITDPGIRKVLLTTFYVAFAVTLLSVSFGFPIAYVLSRLRGRRASLALFLILLPFWASTVIRSFAWMILLGRKGPVNSALLSIGAISEPFRFVDNGTGMMIAMVYIMVPFMVIPILNALRTIDPHLNRAAAVLGANPARQFLVATLPPSLSGVAVGSTVVFVMSLGFFVTPSLLGGSTTMASMLISEQANRLLNWPLASALSITLLTLTVILFGLLRLAVLATRAGRRSSRAL